MTTTVATLEALFTANTSGLMNGLRDADNAISGFGNKIKNVGGNLTSFGAQLGAAVAPAVGLLGGATYAAMAFDEAMTNANSVLQLSGEEIGKVSDKVLAMGTNSIAGPQAVAEAYYEIVSGVADTTSHMAMLDTAIAVSEAGASDLTATTNALVASMNAYGAGADDAAHFGDVLTRITAMGVGSMDEFAAALPNVTSLAANLGISIDDVGAQMAFLTTKGYTASEASTVLAASMTSLINPNETMKKAFGELGVASGEALIQMYGLDGAMQMVAGTSVVATDGLAKALGSTEALKGAMALTGEGAAEFFDTFINGIDESTASARKLQRASAASQFKLIKAQVAGLAITVGMALLPSLIELMNVVSPLLVEISKWVYANPDLIKQIAMVVIGVAGLASVLVPLGIAISAIGVAVSGFATAVGVIAAGFALMVSPIGLIVIGLAAIGLAYRKNFLGFADKVEALEPIFKKLGTHVMDFATDANRAFAGVAKIIDRKALPSIDGLITSFAMLGGLGGGIDIGKQFDTLIKYATDFAKGWQGTNEQLGKFANYISIAGTALGFFIPYVGIAIAVATALYTAYRINFLGFADVVNKVVPIVRDAFIDIIGFFTGFMDALQNGNIGDIAGFIKDKLITPLGDAIGSISLTPITEKASAIGASILEYIGLGLNLISGGVNWVSINIITPLGDAITQFVKSGGLKSAMYNLGKGLMDALQIGVVILGGIGVFIFKNIISPLAASVAQYITSGQLIDDLKALGSALIDAIKWGLNAYIDVNNFIYEQIVAPFAQGILDSIESGTLMDNAKILGTQLIESIKTGITETIPNFIMNNIALPLADMVTSTDWGAVWTNIKTKAETVIDALIEGLTIYNDFANENIVFPLANAIATTDWGAVWTNIKAIGLQLWENFKLGLVVSSTFIYDNLILPLANQAILFVQSGGLYDAVYQIGLFAWNALLTGWKAEVGAATWIYDNLIVPLSNEALQYVQSGALVDNIKQIGTYFWEALKLGILAYAGYTTFFYDNIVAPLYQSLVDSDWSGVINGVAEKGTEIVTSLGESLVNGISGLADDIAQAINALIPDRIHIDIGSITVGKPPFSKTIDFGDIDIPLPNPFKSGTPWTGSVSRDTIAGVVHGQEAVIPTGGMMAKVVPSPNGLTVQTSGGRGGGGISIQTLNVYGVQDVQSLYQQIQKEAQRQSHAVGVW